MGKTDEVPDKSTTATGNSNEEIRWTDDSIRWEGGLYVKTNAGDEDRLGIASKQKENDGKESDDDEDYDVIDPFKLSACNS